MFWMRCFILVEFVWGMFWRIAQHEFLLLSENLCRHKWYPFSKKGYSEILKSQINRLITNLNAFLEDFQIT